MSQSLRGPKILTFSGIGSLLLAAVVGVGVVLLFIDLLPSGVLDADGRAGPDAVGSVEALGSAELTLPAATAYALYVARPSGSTGIALDGSVEIVGPDGEPVRVSAPTVSGSVIRGGVHASTTGAFRTADAGTYTITVPAAASSEDVRVVVVPDQAFGSFFAGVLGTVGGVFVVIALGMIGIGLTVGGGIWWRMRRDEARRVGGSASRSARRSEL